MDDLSGLEMSSSGAEHEVTKGAERLFDFASLTYFPFLRANYEAIVKKEKRFSVPLFGTTIHEQPVFKYQFKCLATLRSGYNDLSDADRKTVDFSINSSF